MNIYLHISTLLAFFLCGCTTTSIYGTSAYTPFSTINQTTLQESVIYKEATYTPTPISIYTPQLYYFRTVQFSFTPSSPYATSSNEFIDDFNSPTTNDSFDDSFDSPPPQSVASTDPLYKFNKSAYNFNSFMYQVVFAPIVKTYDLITPKDVQKGISNLLKNLLAPMRMVTNILKGDFQTAGIEFSKFIVNSTAGFLGYVDITAKSTPSTYRATYLDSTLEKWGIPEGAYIILPLLGPRTLRGTGALIAEIFLNPLTYILDIKPIFPPTTAMRIISNGVLYLDIFYTIEKTSLDPYTAQRELFWQYTRGKKQTEKYKK